MPGGLIIKGVGGLYHVAADDCIYECKARGVFRKKGIVPLPGDRVEISILESEKCTGTIEKVCERSSALIRPPVANVSKLVIVIAASSPKPDLMLLDKLLVMSAKSGIEPIICVNKIDIDSDHVLDYIFDAYSVKCGYSVLAMCAKKGNGISELIQKLSEGLAVFAGQSGVGKSTILNDIFDNDIMETGEVSNRINRGRHTTRHVELLGLPGGGYIADTPGFTSFDIFDIKIDELQLYYPEFRDRTDCCRFKGCRHLEEPDCSVKAAVTTGEIDRGRYERYVELCKCLKDIKAYETKKGSSGYNKNK